MAKKFTNVPPSATGFDWCSKRDKKRRHPSRTDGRTKGNNCIASPLDKYMAKHNRSYKHRSYKEWCEKSNVKNNYKG